MKKWCKALTGCGKVQGIGAFDVSRLMKQES